MTLYVTSGPEYSPMPYADYTDFRRELEDTVDLAAFLRVFMTVGGRAFPENHQGEMVSSTFFSVLGVQPALGRFIGPTDNLFPGGPRVVVLSDVLWRSQFASDPAIVGSRIRLNSELYDVIGVAPPGFRGAVWPTFRSAFWIPAMMADEHFSGRDVLGGRGFAVFQTIGRLAPGIRLEAVQARIDPLDEVLSQDRTGVYYADTGAPWRVRVLPGNYLRLWPEYRNGVATFLRILGLMAVAALGVACANMATLLLARSIEWRHELAIRRALGAARLDLVRRVGAEVVLLVVAGGLGAAALVVWLSALVPQLPLTVAYRLDLIPDHRVFGFGLLIAVLTGCAVATPPVWRVLRDPHSRPILSRTHSSSRSTAMDALVVAQVALSLVLVMGCGLLLRSAWNTQRIDPGFRALHGVSMRVEYPPAWEDEPDVALSLERVLAGLRAESLVTAASASTGRPFSLRTRVEVRVTGSRRVGPDTPDTARFNAVTADYFETFDIPIRAGRVFTRMDTVNGVAVAVINQALATRHFPDRRAVGQTLRVQDDAQLRRIVGVVGSTVVGDIRGAPEPTVYVPYRQYPHRGAHVTIGVRGDGATGTALLRRHVGRLDPSIALPEPTTFAELRRAATRDSRMHAGLATILAVVALSLGLVGLYGVMGYLVHRREREMGIRSALGATPAAIIALVLGRGCRITLLGIALGLAASVGANPLLARLLYDVDPSDVLTRMVVPVLFIAAGIVACWGPARQASRVNPTDALRAE